MIAKLVTGDDFAAVLRYASRKGPLLETNIVSPFGSWEAGPLASEMQLYATCRSDVRKPVLHVAIRLPLQDAVRLIDADFLNIAKLFMTGMEINRNRHQWVVYKHDPDHVHLVINRIDIDRKVWNDRFSHYRAMAACREIEDMCGLTPVSSSPNMEKPLLTRKELAMEVRTGKPSPKRVIYDAVSEVVQVCGSLEDMEAVLAGRGISMFVDHGRGVSFVYDDVAFQGRKVSRCCTLGNITRRISGPLKDPVGASGTDNAIPASVRPLCRQPDTERVSPGNARDSKGLAGREVLSRSSKVMGMKS